MQTETPILSIQNLRRDFKMGTETVHALRGVSYDIYKGEFVTSWEPRGLVNPPC